MVVRFQGPHVLCRPRLTWLARQGAHTLRDEPQIRSRLALLVDGVEQVWRTWGIYIIIWIYLIFVYNFQRTQSRSLRNHCDGCLSSAGVGFWMSLYFWTETGRRICFTCLTTWTNWYHTSSRSLCFCSVRAPVSLNPNTRPVLISPKPEDCLSSSTTCCPEPRASPFASNTSNKNVLNELNGQIWIYLFGY